MQLQYPKSFIQQRIRRIFEVFFYLQNSDDQEETGWLVRKRLLDKLERQLTVVRDHKSKHIRVGNLMCGCQNNAMDRNISEHPQGSPRGGENEIPLGQISWKWTKPCVHGPWRRHAYVKKMQKYTRVKNTSGSYEVPDGIKPDAACRNSSWWDAEPGSPPQHSVPPSWGSRFTWHTQNIWKKD